MQYNVLSVLILIKLIYQVSGQGPPSNPTPSLPSTASGPSTPPPASANTPSPSSTSPSASPSSSPSSTPSSSPSTPPGGSGSSPPATGGAGTDNLPCIKNILSLCEAYQFQFNKVSDDYGCSAFTNTDLFAFHTNLVECSMECDTIMQLEVMRQNVMTNKGQAGPSTHAY